VLEGSEKGPRKEEAEVLQKVTGRYWQGVTDAPGQVRWKQLIAATRIRPISVDRPRGSDGPNRWISQYAEVEMLLGLWLGASHVWSIWPQPSDHHQRGPAAVVGESHPFCLDNVFPPLA
jgi:hypothetical protein